MQEKNNMSVQQSTPKVYLRGKTKKILTSVWVTFATLVVLMIFLVPLFYGLATSLKTQDQISQVDAPLLPSQQKMYTYQGKDYPVYYVPTDSGTKIMALVKKGRDKSSFVDPNNPDAGLIGWEGAWRTLKTVWKTDIKWSNYPYAWKEIKFLLLLRNTVMYAILSTIGAVSSASLVAYGFARFDFPKKNLLFMIVMATIILPPAVTLIPRYTFFYKIGWVGTWLPLIIPAYFSNGYNILLMRQFFLSIPREMDEAAKIDGAGPFRTFISVILPQAIPALVAITLFHFFYCWNDFFEPLVFLAGHPDKFPITIGLTAFNRMYTRSPELIEAASITSAVIPLVIFFFAQRFFMQGVVMTGVEK
jgi:multiple sugar transport system permease protein